MINKSYLFQPGHLTPKQKRQLVKERYKTYTIAAERVKKEEEDRKRLEQNNKSDLSNLTSKTSPLSKLTPKQRRQEDRTRFQTQVLGSPVPEKPDNTLEDEAVKTPSQIPMKTGIPMFRKFGSGSKTYKINKTPEPDPDDRYRTMTLYDKNILKEQRQQESQETEAICSTDKDTQQKSNLEFNLRTENRVSSPNYVNANFKSNGLFEQNSETIVADEVFARLSSVLSQETAENSIPDESNRDTENSNDSQSESDSDSSGRDEKFKVKGGGPRIVKPGGLSRDSSTESNGAEKLESEIPKGIRGRRKPLYSKANLRNSTPQCSPAKQATPATPISRSNSSPLVRGTRATTLRQHNSLQKTNAYAASASNNSSPEKRQISSAKRSSIPQKSSSSVFGYLAKKTVDNTPKLDSPIKPLERQGTFTKDEPEMENTPMVLPSTPCKGKFTKPMTSGKS